MKVILILKGILLWSTVFSIILFIAGGCEYLIESGHWIILLLWILINIALAYACKRYLSYEEAYKVSGLQTLDNLLQ